MEETFEGITGGELTEEMQGHLDLHRDSDSEDGDDDEDDDDKRAERSLRRKHRKKSSKSLRGVFVSTFQPM